MERLPEPPPSARGLLQDTPTDAELVVGAEGEAAQWNRASAYDESREADRRPLAVQGDACLAHEACAPRDRDVPVSGDVVGRRHDDRRAAGPDDEGLVEKDLDPGPGRDDAHGRGRRRGHGPRLVDRGALEQDLGRPWG